MAQEFLILWAGRHQRSAWETLCGEYRGRIERWAPIRDRAVRAAGSAADSRRRVLEGERLLSASPKPSWGIALDSGGKTRSSEKLAQHFRRLREEWPHPIVFYLGSDLGLDDAVLEHSREVLSFGPMTLPHELARLVLYEQIYRALGILEGINYHRPRF